MTIAGTEARRLPIHATALRPVLSAELRCVVDVADGAILFEEVEAEE